MSNFTSRPKHLNAVAGTNSIVATSLKWFLGNWALCFFFSLLFFPHGTRPLRLVVALDGGTAVHDPLISWWGNRSTFFLVSSRWDWTQQKKQKKKQLNWLSSSLVSKTLRKKKRKRKILIYNISLSRVSLWGVFWVSLHSKFTPVDGGVVFFFCFFFCNSNLESYKLITNLWSNC